MEDKLLDRRVFIKQMSACLAAVPGLGALSRNDVLKFTFGFWQADNLQQLFDKLLLTNVSLKSMEGEKIGLFTNAVIVGGNPQSRGTMSATFLARKPVLLPTPVANSWRQWDQIKENAFQEDHVVGVLSHFHHLPAFSQVLELAEDGSLGEISQIDLMVSVEQPAAEVVAGADGSLSWYFHPLWLITKILGNMPFGLKARPSNSGPGFSDIYFDFPQNKKVNLSVKEALPEMWLMNIRGSNGELRWTGRHQLNFKDSEGKTNLFSYDEGAYKLALEQAVMAFVEAAKSDQPATLPDPIAEASVLWNQAVSLSAKDDLYVYLNQANDDPSRPAIRLWEVQ